MKLTMWAVLAGTALCMQAAEPNREFATGREYYSAAQFGKAASLFHVSCNRDGDAEACYWTGLSYERMADISMPFGCRTSAKARHYLQRAANLAPDVAMYRGALFDFLLEDGDCSRTALREAGSILSEMPETDPQFDLMRMRLEQAAHLSGSAQQRLATLFLIIPRTAYDTAAVAGAALQMAVKTK
jgi:hypothetical protein